MSRVVSLLKKAAEKKEAATEHIEPDFQNLEVSDIRKRLFEKIKERQSSALGKKPVNIKDITPKENLPDMKQVTENKKLVKLQEEALKEIDILRLQLEEKNKAILELQSRVTEDPAELKKEKEKAAANIESLRSKLYAATKESKEQSDRLSQLEDMLKNREKRLSDSDKHFKKIESEKEVLYEKLANAENRAKELEDKLLHLESDIASKDKILEEADRAHSKNIEMAKKELVLHMQALEREKRSLDGKISQLNIEIEAKDKRLDESEGSYKELEATVREAALKVENAESAKKELVLQVKAFEREKKTLEGKIGQLVIEIEAKNKRLDEGEKAYRALDDLIKDAALKLEASESRTKDFEEKIIRLDRDIDKIEKARQSDRAAYEEDMAGLRAQIDALNNTIAAKEKVENEFKETMSRLESEIETRDKKIQTDIRYCEGIVKEVNDLRQKMKALRLKIG